MLPNSEAWYNVTEAALNVFETVDLMLLPSSLVHGFFEQKFETRNKKRLGGISFR